MYQRVQNMYQKYIIGISSVLDSSNAYLNWSKMYQKYIKSVSNVLGVSKIFFYKGVSKVYQNANKMYQKYIKRVSKSILKMYLSIDPSRYTSKVYQVYNDLYKCIKGLFKFIKMYRKCIEDVSMGFVGVSKMYLKGVSKVFQRVSMGIKVISKVCIIILNGYQVYQKCIKGVSQVYLICI